MDEDEAMTDARPLSSPSDQPASPACASADTRTSHPFNRIAVPSACIRKLVADTHLGMMKDEGGVRGVVTNRQKNRRSTTDAARQPSAKLDERRGVSQAGQSSLRGRITLAWRFANRTERGGAEPKLSLRMRHTARSEITGSEERGKGMRWRSNDAERVMDRCTMIAKGGYSTSHDDISDSNVCVNLSSTLAALPVPALALLPEVYEEEEILSTSALHTPDYKADSPV